MAWERVEECNQCGLCCLIDHTVHLINSGKGEQELDYLKKLREGWRVIHTTKKKIYLARWDPCPYLSFDLKCQYHGKREQPGICRVWPVFPEGFYQAVKKRCSIKFRRITKAEAVKLKEQGKEVYP